MSSSTTVWPEGEAREARTPWRERLEAASSDSETPLDKLPDADLLAVARGAVTRGDGTRPVLRVFLSSTFTDTRLERDLLLADAYPYLRELGRRLGVDVLQPSEMRWGIRASAAHEHETSAICVHEIERCLLQSSGLAYVLILGDKFGFARLPAVIPGDEYARVAAAVPSADDRALLAHWYREDANAQPPEFRLRPSEADASWWGEVYPQLRAALRAGADVALAEDPGRRDFYYESVTEEEIRHGLLGVPDEERPRVAFVLRRRIANLDELAAAGNASAALLGDFANLAPRASTGPVLLDQEARARLVRVVVARVREATQDTQLREFEVRLGARGINADEHGEYLRAFCDAFCEAVSASIEAAARARKAPPSPRLGRLFNEALSHNASAQARANAFRANASNAAQLDAARAYLASAASGDTAPALAVLAASGAGKTSFMARLAARAGEDCPRAAVVLRFVGTTGASSTGRALLQSVCDQVELALGGADAVLDLRDEEEGAADLEALATRLSTLLPRATRERPLLLFLDALDQLSEEENARALAWLPLRTLPPFVRVVASALPDDAARGLRVASALCAALPAAQVLQLQPTPAADGAALVRDWLEYVGRAVSPQQEQLILRTAAAAGADAGTPLYFNLVFNEARRWRSWDAPKRLPASVSEAVTTVFDRVTEYHGAALSAAALALLTAAPLSTSELLDLLSLDDTVLDAVFEWWEPPVRRLPPLVWTRLRDDLQGFVAERGDDDGTPVLAWFHRQFAESAERRFLPSAAARAAAHQRIADLFDDDAAEEQKRLRLVQPQPLRVAGARAVNARMVRMLPLHLFRAGNATRLRAVLLDLDMLDAALNVDATSALRVLTFWRELLGGTDAAVAAYASARCRTVAHHRAVGKLFRLMGAYAAAAAALEPGLALAGPDERADVQVELADVLNLHADYPRAEELYLAAISALAGEPERVVACSVSLGEMLVHLGRYAQARELFVDALAAAEQQHGPEHLAVAAVCDKYAGLLRTQVRFAPDPDTDAATEALTEELYSRAVQIRERALGKGHLDYAEACFGLARFFLAKKRFDEARELLESVAAAKEGLLGYEHPDATQVRYNMAMLEMESGNLSLSEKLFNDAIDSWCARLAPDHPYVATALQAKAKLLVKQDRRPEAVAALRRCLAIRKARFSEDHPRYVDAKKELDALLADRRNAKSSARCTCM